MPANNPQFGHLIVMLLSTLFIAFKDSEVFGALHIRPFLQCGHLMDLGFCLIGFGGVV